MSLNWGDESADVGIIQCAECNDTGEILQDDGSDSTGTLIICECQLLNDSQS